MLTTCCSQCPSVFDTDATRHGLPLRRSYVAPRPRSRTSAKQPKNELTCCLIYSFKFCVSRIKDLTPALFCGVDGGFGGDAGFGVGVDLGPWALDLADGLGPWPWCWTWLWLWPLCRHSRAGGNRSGSSFHCGSRTQLPLSRGGGNKGGRANDEGQSDPRLRGNDGSRADGQGRSDSRLRGNDGSRADGQGRSDPRLRGNDDSRADGQGRSDSRLRGNDGSRADGQGSSDSRLRGNDGSRANGKAAAIPACAGMTAQECCTNKKPSRSGEGFQSIAFKPTGCRVDQASGLASRNSRRRILPTLVLGSSLRNSTMRGCL